MARPRHAEPARGRAVAIAVGVAVVVAAVVVTIAVWPRSSGSDSASPAARSSASGNGSPSTPGGNDTRGTGSTSPAPASASASAESAEARASLQACITRVRSTDEVLNQAAIGIHNWSVHVQAQYAADRGLISVATMDRRFAKTRAQGPDDIQRYREALQAQQPVGDACDTRPNANPVVARKIAACQQRIAAQQPVLRTAAVAMGDWNMHLKDMARHADGEVPGAVAQQIWVRTYRAAPKHIDPYERAAAQLDAAPTCT